MTEEKSIVVACDDKSALSAILNSMKEINAFTPNIISVARISDLISISKSLNPDLIIVSFRNNQLTLNDCVTFIKKPEIPILCLTHKYETKALSWNRSSIVFTYPLEFINNEGFLTSTMQSVFLLRSESSVRIKSNSFADIAIQSSHANDNARNLSRHVMELDQKVELLSQVKGRISQLFPRVDDRTRAELVSIVNSIKVSINDSKIWDDFKLYFEHTDPNFLLFLAKKHPNLTTKDLKYCCYLKMNMTNDDIRNLLGINQESVRTHKHRLKKKMTIPKDQDLRSYLLSLEKQEEYQAV